MARQSEFNYAESIVDTIREALIVLDQDLRVVTASQSFYRQFLVNQEETEGRLIFELGNRQWDIPELRHLLESIIPGKTTIEGFEVRHNFEDIGEKVMLLNARRLEREAGNPGLILLAIEDITAQYIAQQKLAESETKYRKFVEEINSIIIVFDSNDKITFFNHFAEKLFGYSRNEVIGKPIMGTIIPYIDSTGRDNNLIAREIIADPQKYYANESEGVRKDGSRVVFSWSAKVVQNASGAVAEIFIDGNDITELSVAQKKLEENTVQLKNERDFVSAVLQTSGALICVIDRDGKITRFNSACEELTGYASSEVLGHNLFDLFIPAEERGGVTEVASRLLNGDRRVDYENHWITKSGEKRYIRWRNSNLLDENGLPVYAVATGIDITDRKRVEDALRKSEEQFRNERDLLQQIVNNLPYSFVLYSPDLKIEYTNETVLKRYHLALKEVQGKAVPELFSKEISDIYVPLLQNVRDTGEPFSGEVSYHVGGSLHTNIPNIVPLKNERNEIQHLIILSIDITERKRMENALRESEERFRVTQELSPDGFLIFRPLRNAEGAVTDFIWLYENAAAAQMNDTKPEDVIGRRVSEVLPNHYKSPFGKAYKEVAETGEVRVVEDAFYDQDTFQQLRWFRVVAVPISGGDLAILVQNVTERKQAEEALHARTQELMAANKDLESFSYSVSHDLRTPLTSIKGFSEILMKKYGAVLDEQGKSILGNVILSADKMSAIITDLISLARISKEKMNCQKIDLSHIADSVIAELRQAEPQRNVMVNIAPAMLAWADPGFIDITLTNLIGNAWKYTGKNNEARIDIGSTRTENETVFFIRDNGIGFDMSLADKLFKPFQRLHSDNQFKGTGIGLAIVKRIIQRHGGKIWAESQPGRGTVFYFTLLSCSQ